MELLAIEVILVLQAIDQNGEKIVPASFEKDKLIQLKLKRRLYFCPECMEPVILKAGVKVVPHFAHRSIGKCSGGGEGAYHEIGKWHLFKWLSNQGLNVELEAYIPEIGRRPDLLLSIGNTRIAIEYQCAQISSADLSTRMKDYAEGDIEQIWILGGNRLKRLGSSVLSLNRFAQQFLHYFEKSPNEYLYFFCPESMQFATFQNPHFSTGKKAFGSLRIRKLHECSFTDLFTDIKMPIKSLAQYWVGEKKMFRLSAGRHAYGAEHQFRQWLYLNGWHVETLPACIGLPVRNAHFMKIPLFQWQARLVMDWIRPHSKQRHFLTAEQISHRLKPFHEASSQLPKTKEHQDPIQNYMTCLKKLGFVNLSGQAGYEAEIPIKLYENVEQSMYEDQMIMREWMQMMKCHKQIRSMNHLSSAIL